MSNKKTTEDTESCTSLFVRPKDCKYSAADLPIIQNLLGLGYDVDDIGMLMSYQGDNWKIAAAKGIGPEYKEAIENGLKLADASMVKALQDEAFGYDWTEVQETFKAVTDYDPDLNEVTTKLVKTGEKRTKRHQPGNARLAELLVVNRLPDLFKRVQEIKKQELTANVSGEMSSEQIEHLVGRLLQAVQKQKPIDAEVINGQHESFGDGSVVESSTDGRQCGSE